MRYKNLRQKSLFVGVAVVFAAAATAASGSHSKLRCWVPTEKGCERVSPDSADPRLKDQYRVYQCSDYIAWDKAVPHGTLETKTCLAECEYHREVCEYSREFEASQE